MVWTNLGSCVLRLRRQRHRCVVGDRSNTVVSGDPLTNGATARVIAQGDSDRDQVFNPYCVNMGGANGGTVRNTATWFTIHGATSETGCPSP
jgi:hypothetical protein